ncbi:hypothetical protein D3C72_2357600 [compost metagenome]
MTPRIENQMTARDPKRSPIGPPSSTPAAEAPRKRKSIICACWTPTWNFSMAKKVK